MKVFKIVLFFVFIGISSFAQDKGLLFELSGKDLTKPSYIFGTIHMLCAEDYKMSDSVKNAFLRSEQVTLEIDMDEPGMMFKAMKGMKMKGDTALKNLMNESDFAKTKTYLADSLHLPFGMLDKMKPALWLAIILPKQLGCDAIMYEDEFKKMAKLQKKEMLGLETIEFQLNVFDKIPYKIQADELLKAINDPVKSKNEFLKLANVYKSENLNALLTLIQEDSGMASKYKDDLIINRNAQWIPSIISMAQGKSTFFAVGAGHLAGETGVLKLLQKQGYTIRVLD